MVAVIKEESFAQESFSPAIEPTSEPIVIVGTGPAGARTVHELVRRLPEQPIVWCGAEKCEPYNRVHLSSLLAGELELDRFGSDYLMPPNVWLDRRLGCEVVSIDRDAKFIVDSRGNRQHYARLVLATGSKPRIPNIPNVAMPGVYTFRNFADAQALAARLTRSRRTVVIGGGLLGLEAAKAMHRSDTQVTVLEGLPRLMMRQLDDAAAIVLRRHIEELGIEVRLSVGIRGILGDEYVTGIQLTNEEIISCDTIIVATGIIPNVDLAKCAGLNVGSGILIDDETRTSDPNIHAVGECAQHRGVVYGLAAPGIEQATVAASVIAGDRATYDGTVTSTRLKVVGMPVFSVGEVLDDSFFSSTQAWSYCSKDRKTFTRLVTRNGRLVGATAIGDIADVGRLQDAVLHHRLIWIWQLWSFLHTGKMWREAPATDVAQWPATTTVCNCMSVTRGQLSDAMNAGCTTAEALATKTGASKVCGSCKPLLAQLTAATAGDTTQIKLEKSVKTLYWLASVAGVLALLWLMPWSIPYAESVTAPSFDALWRESFWKQVSGYSLLGGLVLALVMSLRKRVARFRAGDFSWWRVAHAALGVCTLVGLLVHTGGRLGSGLNFALSLCFMALITVGAYASLVIAKEQQLGARGVAIRRQTTWLHIVAFWPLPVLLAFHVLKTYYF